MTKPSPRALLWSTLVSTLAGCTVGGGSGEVARIITTRRPSSTTSAS